MDSNTSYVILAECNGKHYETWYTFIKYEGNEEALQHLQRQLEKVEFYILDDLSTFDLDLEHKVNPQTAKEMTKVEVNSVLFHRKFDGALQMIDLGFRSKDSNDKKIVKAFDRLGVGKVEDFLDGEDVDPEDLTEGEGDSSSESGSDSSEDDYEYNISDSSEEESSSEDDRKLSRKEVQRRRLVEKLKKMKGLGKK